MSEPVASHPASGLVGATPPTTPPPALASLAREVFAARPELGEDIRARPGIETGPQFLASLMASTTPEEAVTFCAYLLPPAAAVGWGHRCLAAWPAAIGEWLACPHDDRQREDLRREILDMAVARRPRSPAVWVSLGLGWSSGSISAPDLPTVPAPAFATPRAINAGILGLLARVGLAERAATLEEFVSFARRIAAAIVSGDDIRQQH